MFKFIWSLVDEAHERAALGLFVSAWLLRLFADFGDWSTVSMFALAAVTLVGQQRYAGLNFGPSGFSVSAQTETKVSVAPDEDTLPIELQE